MLIVDTGVLVAVGDEADRYYKPCRDLLETDQGPLVTNALVVAETAYMVRRGLGGVAELALLEMVRDGTLIVENPVLVVETGVDPVTFRFSGGRSAN